MNERFSNWKVYGECFLEYSNDDVVEVEVATRPGRIRIDVHTNGDAISIKRRVRDPESWAERILEACRMSNAFAGGQIYSQVPDELEPGGCRVR